MTDVPFASLSIVFLWLHLRGTNRHSPVTIAAAFAAALAATFIRQFGLFLPLAFAAALIVRRGVTWPTLAQAILPLALFTGLHILFQHWVIATGRAPRFNEALGSLAHVSLKARLPIVKHFATAMIPYVGLFLLPILPALIRAAPARKTTFWLASILLALALVAGLAHAHEFVPSLGNLLRPYGLGPLTLRDTFLLAQNEPIRPEADLAWTTLTLLAAWATAITALLLLDPVIALLRRPHPSLWPQAMMLTFIAANLGAIAVATLLDDVFDRYLLALVIPLCALLHLTLQPGDRALKRHWPALAPLAACALFAVAAAHDYFAFNRARWSAIDALIAQGTPPTAIDGGFEYGGWTMFDLAYRERPGISWWWVQDDAYVIALGPIPGRTTVAQVDFPHWLWPDTATIHVLRRNKATSAT